MEQEEADSPGTTVLASLVSGRAIIGADSLGARGKRAEDVGREAGSRMASLIESGAAVDSNLADMLCPLLSLAEGDSALRVQEVSPHLRTGMYVAGLFTGCDCTQAKEGRTSLVRVRPKSGHNA